jgi:hypothetical protein
MPFLWSGRIFSVMIVAAKQALSAAADRTMGGAALISSSGRRDYYQLVLSAWAENFLNIVAGRNIIITALAAVARLHDYRRGAFVRSPYRVSCGALSPLDSRLISPY